MRIGELADAVGVNPKTIRFYETIGLLPAPRRLPSGYRDYSEDDLQRVVFVRTAQRLGLPLSDIGEILAFKERGETPCGYVRAVLARQVAELDDRIGELIALRDQLRALQAATRDLPPQDGRYCGVIEHAQALTSPDTNESGSAIAGITTSHRARAHRRRGAAPSA